MNSKIIIINPDDADNNMIVGKINYVGDLNSDEIHGDLLTSYGLRAYGEDSIFGILSMGNYLTDVPVYFLCEGNDNVVFLNVSNSKIGKFGLLYLPQNISFKQKRAINSLNFSGFEIEVNYNLRVDDGIVDSDRKRMNGDKVFFDISSKTKKKA